MDIGCKTKLLKQVGNVNHSQKAMEYYEENSKERLSSYSI